MDITEKRKGLIKFCENADCMRCCFLDIRSRSCSIADVGTDAFCKAPDEMIEMWHAIAFPEPAHPDYEAEYHKLLKENEKLNAECKYLMNCKCCGKKMELIPFHGKWYWICEDCEIWEEGEA